MTEYIGFKEELKIRTAKAEEAVIRWLPAFPDYEGNLCEAMRYSVTAGGKRLRPVMLAAACDIFGGDLKEAEPFMAAIEYIHTSSLIHDDLPAIDNDELRRGKPTVHAAFGEETGILAGDALLNYAYEVMIQGVSGCKNTGNGLKAAEILCKKSGLFGMLGGQGLDVGYEKGQFDLERVTQLQKIYEMKTSGLIEASLMSGAALAGASKNDLDLLEQIGSDVGIAFQIRDDILDITATTEKLGKPAHSDEKNMKKTYISFLGLEKAAETAEELTIRAVENSKKLPGSSLFLQDLIQYLLKRDY